MLGTVKEKDSARWCVLEQIFFEFFLEWNGPEKQMALCYDPFHCGIRVHVMIWHIGCEPRIPMVFNLGQQNGLS